MKIHKRSLDGVPLLQIEEDVDHSSADALEVAVVESLESGNRLLLDLTRCDYLDSGGLAVMLSTVKRLDPGGWLGVIGCNPNVCRLFQIVGLTVHPALRMFPGPQEASEALAGEQV